MLLADSFGAGDTCREQPPRAVDRRSGLYEATLAARVRSLRVEGLSVAAIHQRTGIGFKIIHNVFGSAEGGAI